MPQIQGYENQVIAQGGLNVQASPDAFGAGIGEAAQNLGRQVDRMGDAIQAADNAMDVTNVHVTFAKARAEWDKNLEMRRREATPGDDTFAPRLMEDVEKWAKDASGSVKTRQGANLFKSMAANMATEYNGRALAAQANLNSEAAVNMLGTLKSSAVETAKTDVSTALGTLDAAFADKNSIFGKLNQAHRDAMRTEARRDAIAAHFIAQGDSGVLDPAVYSPAVLKELNAYKATMNQKAVPGGAIKISEATMEKAPEFAAVAASKNILANILMAQHDVLPNNTPEVQGEIMGNLKAKYGDVAKAVAAYQGGTAAVDFAVGMGGDYWGDYLPDETKAHVETVMVNAGQEPSDNPVPPLPVNQAKTSNPLFNELTPAQQEHVATAGLRSLEQIRTIATWNRQETERQKREASDASVDAGVKMIYNARQFGRFSIEAVTRDNAMDGDTKHKVIAWYLNDQERRKSGASLDDRGMRTRLYQDLLRQAQDGNSPNMSAVNDAMLNGRVNPETHAWLQSRALNLQNDSGTSFGINFKKAARGADLMIQRGIAKFDPVAGAQIMERAKADLFEAYEMERDERQKAGKPTASLVDPNSKDFSFSAARVNAVVNAAMSGVGGEQAQALAKADAEVDRSPSKHPISGEQLSVGQVYELPGKGRLRYLGGKGTVSTSWEPEGMAQPVAPGAPPVGKPESRMQNLTTRTLKKFWTGGR